MASAVVKKQESIPSLEMAEEELLSVLRTSLYPGAQDTSIRLVIGYCRASQLDPMQKPVHIVPMWDNKSKQMRDTIMPGIGLYRTQAARSGQYAGISEPEFGPEITETLDGVTVKYPEWCRVTVRRLMDNGNIAEFTSVERWKENYATIKRDSDTPNAMWQRRPYAQLAKCCEAQSLRKAFPEFGAQPTAEEMEGHQEIDITPQQAAPTPPETPRARPASAPKNGASAPQRDVIEGEIVDRQEAKAATAVPAQAGMLVFLRKKAEAKGITDDDLCKAHGVSALEGISVETVNAMIEWIRQQ